jgi:cytochrome c nitrite reductase small subunit
MKKLPMIRALGLLLACLSGVLIGSGGYTFYYAEGASYLSDDPKACINCHIMQEVYDGWAHSSHHAVAVCNDCHVPHDFFAKWLVKASNGYHHSRAFTFQDFHEPIQIRPVNLAVLNRNCVYCHAELSSEIRGLAGTETGHALTAQEPMDCVRCHRAVGHGPTE